MSTPNDDLWHVSKLARSGRGRVVWQHTEDKYIEVVVYRKEKAEEMCRLLIAVAGIETQPECEHQVAAESWHIVGTMRACKHCGAPMVLRGVPEDEVQA